jgi:hypothetical protein
MFLNGGRLGQRWATDSVELPRVFLFDIGVAKS